MFNWTVEKLFAAIDAGITSIIAEYNAQYAAIAERFGPDALPTAHQVVQAQMVAELNGNEGLLAAEREQMSVLLLVDRIDEMAYRANVRAEDWAEAV